MAENAEGEPGAVIGWRKSRCQPEWYGCEVSSTRGVPHVARRRKA
jgi:hypothetical protein